VAVVYGGTDLKPVASHRSDFSPRLPWWGGDLQTIRNYALSLDHALPSRATRQIIVPLSDGSGDRLVVSLHMPEESRERPLVVLIHGISGNEGSCYMVVAAAYFLARGHPVLKVNLRGAGPSRPYRATAGPLLVVGSSMGGWIMLLVALARPARIAGLIGVAAAPDFTADLLLPQATPEQRRALADQGYWMQPSAYGGDPYPVTRRFLEEADEHLVLRAPLPIRCPVHLLHGQRDPDVPWQTALRLAERLQSDDVTVELIKAGDHRLSLPPDLARITAAIERLAAASSGS
jgi:pimeloyl-ACP methyl ester carboxylesterase